MLELMPDGETFKKLTRGQSAALERYYKREKGDRLCFQRAACRRKR